MVDRRAPAVAVGLALPGEPVRLRDGLHRRVWAIYAAMGVVLMVYIAVLAVRPPQEQWTIIDGWGVAGFELLAAALCVAAGWKVRPRSPVPIILGAAIACWSLGDFLLTIESLGGATPPSPSLADAFYLPFFPLCYVALMLFVREQARGLTVADWLDGAVTGLGAAAVCAAFAFSMIEQTTGNTALGTGVNLAYPIGDVLLLLMLAAAATVMPLRWRGPWLLLAVGIAVNVFGDTANLFQPNVGSTSVGNAIDSAAWPISTLLMSMAMWLRPVAPDPLRPRRQQGFLLPGLAAAAGLGVLFTQTLHPLNRIATALATATLVLVVLRTWLSVRELRAQHRERQHQSLTDHLTGVANRRQLFDVLDAVFGADAQERPAVAFLFIDLNGFKQVNDAFGHPVGDKVLQRIGARLSRALDGSGLLARVGGDEFAVVLVGHSAEQASEVALRLSTRLDEPMHIDAATVRIGATIGIARFPGDARDSGALMSCADMAMYRAKLAGARVASYDPTFGGDGDRLQLADDLSAAIDSNSLVLHYQAQLDLHTRQVATVEALVRWAHPALGLISPLSFLPLAAEAGLMGKVTDWVLDQALAQCATWRRHGHQLRVSVNVSAGDLLDPGFPDLVSSVLRTHGLPTASLLLEITETSIIEEFDRASAAVSRLRELGVGVSIDDFGAGFTSLAYLNRLEVGEVKLDRSFIAPLAGGARTRTADLVGATIDLGHALGLRVVAEGVEDEATLELMVELGCDVAQGYAIGKPLPAAELPLNGVRADASAAA
jgi:diguanylate cyclase (GGDEF)-like protein